VQFCALLAGLHTCDQPGPILRMDRTARLLAECAVFRATRPRISRSARPDQGGGCRARLVGATACGAYRTVIGGLEHLGACPGFHSGLA